MRFDGGLSKALGEKTSSFASVFHSNMCIPYRELGRLEEAHVSFKEAHSICLASGDSLGRLCALGNSGTLLIERENAMKHCNHGNTPSRV